MRTPASSRAPTKCSTSWSRRRRLWIPPAHRRPRTPPSKGVREALRILEEKATPEEVDGFKGFVRDVAQATARARKEGGFLGVGGKEISPDEQTALDEVEAVLSR